MELGMENSLKNPTYTPVTLTKGEILNRNSPILCSCGISIKHEQLDLPSHYWISKLRKCPIQCYIVEFSKF